MNIFPIPQPIDGTTRLLGVLGDPVAHTLSPTMHNLALAALGLNYRYLAFHVTPQRLPEAVRGLVALGAAGFNATIPHKELLHNLMDSLSEEASLTGAVNTVAIDENGRLHGYNTDVYGFKTALTDAGFSPTRTDCQAVILGAGGAARGVLEGLWQLGVQRFIIVNRTPERAHQIIMPYETAYLFPDRKLQAVAWDEANKYLKEADLLINATSLGLRGETLPGIDLGQLPGHAIVQDCVYSRTSTPLIRAAKQRGLATADGLAMLIHQGAKAFKIWTGQDMPIDLVKDHFRQLLGEP